MSNKIFYPVLIIILIALSLLTIKKNSSFLNINRHYGKIITRPRLSPSVQYRRLQSSCEATAQYRHDVSRSGVAPSSARLKKALKILHHQFPFNIDIHSASKASPTVDDSGVYVGSDSGWFWKLNHDGEKLWSFYIPTSSNGIHSSAAVDDKKVYISAYNGFVYALDKDNGDLIWATPVAEYIGASPLLAGGALYIAGETHHPDGLLAKLDCNNGEMIWVSDWFQGHSHSSPAFHSGSNQIFVGANSGTLFAIDARTGKTNWKKQFKGPIKGTPLLWQGQVFFNSWDKKLHALRIKDGEELWSKFMGGRLQSSLTLVPDMNLGLTNTPRGDIAAVDLNTGEFRWRLRHGDRDHQFSLAVSKDPMRRGEYLAWSRCKKIQLCTVDARTGKLLNHIDLPGSFSGVPFPWRDRLFISLDKDDGFVILK